MENYRLAFTDTEEALVAQIDFQRAHTSHRERRAAFLSNCEPILVLMRSLTDRGAIPARRLSYWNDPEYKPGRTKGSRRHRFERNGCTGEDIYVHPNFMPHLRYILFGADLPPAVIAEFESKVGDPQFIDYSDTLELGTFARAQVRRNRLDPCDAFDEYLKLALDLGLGVDKALRISRFVKDTR